MKLEIVKRDGCDVTFVVPWKGKDVQVTWEEPIGCLNGGFQFDLDDDDESEELEEFLWDNIEINTYVTVKGNEND